MTKDDEPEPECSVSCDPTIEELYSYIDGYLGEPRKTEFKSHLETCTGCDDVYHFHIGLRSMLGSCREEMPADVRRRLLDSITKLF